MKGVVRYSLDWRIIFGGKSPVVVTLDPKESDVPNKDSRTGVGRHQKRVYPPKHGTRYGEVRERDPPTLQTTSRDSEEPSYSWDTSTQTGQTDLWSQSVKMRRGRGRLIFEIRNGVRVRHGPLPIVSRRYGIQGTSDLGSKGRARVPNVCTSSTSRRTRGTTQMS